MEVNPVEQIGCMSVHDGVRAHEGRIVAQSHKIRTPIVERQTDECQGEGDRIQTWGVLI